MCNYSKNQAFPSELTMEGAMGHTQNQEGCTSKLSVLLELSASDDLAAFRAVVEEEGGDLDESGLWYGRRLGLKKMGFKERTPLMVASMFGSKQVVSYILEKGRVDVNKACGSDGATALHCAVAGGSVVCLEIVRLLLDASADVSSVDANGKRPIDLIASVQNSRFNPRIRMLEHLLKGGNYVVEAYELIDYGIVDEKLAGQVLAPGCPKEGSEKKEYPVDPSLPDIKNGIYGTDEFRMYTFKIKPCSRAYSHDWTECPFVHPGENARRRDPRKFHYSCVPCPDFRKGTCQRGDACEYAHGIFECWLHPAQYRTRLCKDEASCNRRVCFFAHKPEELRPLYASTGSAVPSPRSFAAASSLDIASMNPFSLSSPSVKLPPTSTPPMSPSGAASSMWSNQCNLMPPTLQLPSSRLKSAINARDMDLDAAALLGLDIHQRQEQLMDDLAGLSSPSSWRHKLASATAFGGPARDHHGEFGMHMGVSPTNLDDCFGAPDPTMFSHLENISMDSRTTQLQSLRSSYPTPIRTSSPFGPESSGVAATVLNSRAAAFAKRSQSFIDRSPVSRQAGLSSPLSSAGAPSALSDWGSPDGKLDWGIQKGELNKLRKSSSFGLRTSGGSLATRASPARAPDEPDVSWVQSLVKEPPASGPGRLRLNDQQYHFSNGGPEMLPAWMDQLCVEQDRIVT